MHQALNPFSQASNVQHLWLRLKSPKTLNPKPLLHPGLFGLYEPSLSLLQHSQKGSARVGPPARVRALGCRERTGAVGQRGQLPACLPQHPNTKTPNPPRRLWLVPPYGRLWSSTVRPEGGQLPPPRSGSNCLHKPPQTAPATTLTPSRLWQGNTRLLRLGRQACTKR